MEQYVLITRQHDTCDAVHHLSPNYPQLAQLSLLCP